MRAPFLPVLISLFAVTAMLPGCANDPLEPVPFGIANPRGGIGLAAPWEFGRTADLDGRLLPATVAALRVEQFALAADREPLWQTGPNPTLQPQLRLARAEMRQALGISPRLPPEDAARALSAAAVALRDNRAADAEAALSGPGFTLGGGGTLARLANLPRLPQVDFAAQAVAQQAAPSSWNSR